MNFVVLVLFIAFIYFPVVWLGGKLFGDKGATTAIIFMIVGTIIALLSIPVSFYMFLRYGL